MDPVPAIHLHRLFGQCEEIDVTELLTAATGGPTGEIIHADLLADYGNGTRTRVVQPEVYGNGVDRQVYSIQIVDVSLNLSLEQIGGVKDQGVRLGNRARSLVEQHVLKSRRIPWWTTWINAAQLVPNKPVVKVHVVVHVDNKRVCG